MQKQAYFYRVFPKHVGTIYGRFISAPGRIISAGLISHLYRQGVDHLRTVDKEDFSEGYNNRANNATPKNRIPWRELFPRSVASRPAHRDSWQALLMRMNDEMARRGLAAAGRSMESCG